MTIERIAVLEVEAKHFREDIEELKVRLAEANAKLDQLVKAANMGQGAWWAATKVGGLVVMAGVTVAWVIDHITKFIK